MHYLCVVTFNHCQKSWLNYSGRKLIVPATLRPNEQNLPLHIWVYYLGPTFHENLQHWVEQPWVHLPRQLEISGSCLLRTVQLVWIYLDHSSLRNLSFTRCKSSFLCLFPPNPALSLCATTVSINNLPGSWYDKPSGETNYPGCTERVQFTQRTSCWIMVAWIWHSLNTLC